MKRLGVVPFAIALLLAALVPAAALAKGASEAEITGPGLEHPISLSGEGQPGGEQLMQIAEAAGFFAATFGQVPDPMLDRKPSGNLGPRYRITYVMPGPNNELDDIRQDLYPYASPAPVSYTPPGQPFFGTERTRGGWYVAATPFLKDALVAAGLPRTPPDATDGSPFPWRFVGALVSVGLILAIGAVVAMLLRRRPQTA